MLSRKFILERAGHTVIGATNDREIVAACDQHRFDVAVIGHNASVEKKRALVPLLRTKCPSVKILELYFVHEGKSLKNADSWLPVPIDEPSQLAERVSELAQQSRK